MYPFVFSLFSLSFLQPTGDAVALLLVPTLHGGDTRVFLWGRTNPATPTHVLSGHTDAVLEVQWIDGSRLATWSRDRTLRVWTINDQLQFNLGGEIGGQESNAEEHHLPSSPPLTIAPALATSTTPTITSSADTLSLEGSSGEKGRAYFGGVENALNPAMSLPLIKTHGLSEVTPTMGGAGSGMVLSGSPSTHSLASISSTSSLSSINPVVQSIGGHSLAKEFSQLRTETIPNLEIERVSRGGRSSRHCWNRGVW